MQSLGEYVVFKDPSNSYSSVTICQLFPETRFTATGLQETGSFSMGNGWGIQGAMLPALKAYLDKYGDGGI